MVTSVSRAVLPFLKEVEELWTFPDGTIIAFDVVITLAEYSYQVLECGGSGYGDRPSALKNDDVLVELGEEPRILDSLWDFAKVLESLEQ